MPHAMPFQRGLLVASAYFHMSPMAVTHSTTDDTLREREGRRRDGVGEGARNPWIRGMQRPTRQARAMRVVAQSYVCTCMHTRPTLHRVRGSERSP